MDISCIALLPPSNKSMPSDTQVKNPVIQNIVGGDVENREKREKNDDAAAANLRHAYQQQQQPLKQFMAPLRPPGPTHHATETWMSSTSGVSSNRKPPFSSLNKAHLLMGLTCPPESRSSTETRPHIAHAEDGRESKPINKEVDAPQSATDWVDLHCEGLGISAAIFRSSSNETGNHSFETLPFLRRDISITSVIKKTGELGVPTRSRRGSADLSCCSSISSRSKAPKRPFDAISLLLDSKLGSYSMSDDSCMRSRKRHCALSRSSSFSSSIDKPHLLRGISASSMGSISLYSLLSQTIDPLPKPLLVSTASGGSALSNGTIFDDDGIFPLSALSRASSCDSRAWLREFLAKSSDASRLDEVNHVNMEYWTKDEKVHDDIVALQEKKAPEPRAKKSPPKNCTSPCDEDNPANLKCRAKGGNVHDDIMDLAEQQKKAPKPKAKTSPPKKRHDTAPEDRVYYPKTSNDVICGRGSGASKHNETFRNEHAGPKRDAYKQGHNAEKETIVKELMDFVHNRGGRFLEKDGKGYFEVTHGAARAKLQKMTNEFLTQEEREAKKAAKEAGSKKRAATKKTSTKKKKP